MSKKLQEALTDTRLVAIRISLLDRQVIRQQVPWDDGERWVPWAAADTDALQRFLADEKGIEEAPKGKLLEQALHQELRKRHQAAGGAADGEDRSRFECCVVATEGGGPPYNSYISEVWPDGQQPCDMEIAKRLLGSYGFFIRDAGGSITWHEETFGDFYQPIPLAIGGDAIWRCGEDHVWVEVKESEIFARITSWQGRPVGKCTLKIPSRQLREAITTMKHLIAAHGFGEGFFDAAPQGFAFGDGRFCGVDVDDGLIFDEPLTPEHRQKAMLDGVSPAALMAAEGGVWGPEGSMLRRYLTTAHEGADDAEERVLAMGQMVFAAITQTAPRFVRAFLCCGGAGAGKSTFAQLMQSLVPEDAQARVSLSETGSETHVATLQGKWLNSDTEIDLDIVDPKKFKAICCGEPVLARNLYGRPFPFKPRCAQLYCGNKLPKFKGGSENAIWDRWLPIAFERRFRGEADAIPDIGKKIATEEREPLVAWAIHCGRILLKEGAYRMPPSSVKLIKAWKGMTDPVEAWLDSGEVLGVGEAFRTPRTRAYTCFAEWAKASGYQPINASTFYERLKEAGILQTKTASGTRMVFLSLPPSII
jgi:energy-coupling factor transporter ATP-binding protein EcfA2